MAYFTPEQINAFFPVIGILVYPGGMKIQRGCNLNLNRQNYAHERMKITMVNKRSLARLALLVRGSSVEFTSLMTLTYGANFPVAGKVAKKHLNHLLIGLKRSFGLFEYVWVLEFQERGAVHFHIATTLPAPDDVQREIFARKWQLISTPYSWAYSQVEYPYGVENFKQGLMTDQAVFEMHKHKLSWERIRNDDRLSHYIAKYSMKIRQKVVPSWYGDVGRFWGASKGVALPDGEYFHGSDELVRQVGVAYGRDLSRFEVLPEIILIG